jgi:hypothetical protein
MKQLLESAKTLSKPSKESAKEYSEAIQIITTSYTTNMKERDEIENHIGNNKDQYHWHKDMIEDSYQYRTKYMESLFENFAPENLVDTCLWAMRAIRSRGMEAKMWNFQLLEMKKLLEEKLSPQAASEICPIYDWMLENVDEMAIIADSQLE